MISSDILQFKRERDVTMSLWTNWLFRRLLDVPTPSVVSSIGVLDFCSGRETKRQLAVGAMSWYVLFGHGHHEFGPNAATLNQQAVFSQSSVLTLANNQAHAFVCEEPTRFLVVSSDRPAEVIIHTTPLGVDQVVRGQATCYYVLDGDIEVRVGNNTQRLLTTTAFSIAPQIEYTLCSISKQNAVIVAIDVQAAATHGPKFAQTQRG